MHEDVRCARRWGAAALTSVLLGAAMAWPAPSAAAAAQDKGAAPAQKASAELPALIARAAKRWKVDMNDVVIAVMPLESVRADERGRTNAAKVPLALGWNALRADRPASTAKLVTTLVGLETLGANFHWRTGFYWAGEPDAQGRLKTPLYIRGGGDPTMVIEDFAMQVDKLAQMGVRHLDADIVIDRSYFDIAPFNPAAFDGRSSRPYNLGPDAALMNYRNLSLELIPNKDGQTARVVAVPHMAGFTPPASVKLTKGGCGDWKTKLGFKIVEKPDGTKEGVFTGGLARACGPKNFNVIAFEPNEYFERVFRALWERDGRTWRGRVKDGRIPSEAERKFVRLSPQLSEVVALVNKWSNNTMARHVFLTLGQAKLEAEAAKAAKTARKAAGKTESAASQWQAFPRGTTLADGRQVVADWLADRGLDPKKIHIDNGSGLSRETRVTGRAMAEVLAAGWVGPYGAEYAASLPITGEDGTMLRRKIAVSHGRIKTGFLTDVRSVGGYVQAKSGKRYAVYASVRGKKNMPGATAFLDNVILWTYQR